MKDWRIALAAAAGTAALIGTAQAITDTAFTYRTPKVGYYPISPLALMPDFSGGSYAKNFTRLSINGVGCFSTGVNLPQGAKLQTVVIWYVSGVGADARASLYRNRPINRDAEQAIVLGTDNSGTPRQASGVVPAVMAAVDNAVYNYSFQWCSQSDDNDFLGARIRYTYSDAGD